MPKVILKSILEQVPKALNTVLEKRKSKFPVLGGFAIDSAPFYIPSRIQNLPKEVPGCTTAASTLESGPTDTASLRLEDTVWQANNHVVTGELTVRWGGGIGRGLGLEKGGKGSGKG